MSLAGSTKGTDVHSRPVTEDTYNSVPYFKITLTFIISSGA